MKNLNSNWKMFRGPDPVALAGLDAVVCPPFTRLRDCVDAGLTTYAQHVHWEKEGAYTGEISAPLLLEPGVVARSSATPSGGSSSARRTRTSRGGRRRRSRRAST